MEDLQALTTSALQSIGAAQAIAIAAAAGFVMKDTNQILTITLGALIVDRFVNIIRQAVDGEPLARLTQASWQSLLSLPMGTFMAAFLSFGLVVWLSFAIKSAMKRL